MALVTVTLSGLDTSKMYTVDVIISDANIEAYVPGQERGETVALNNETPTALYFSGPTIYDFEETFSPSSSTATISIAGTANAAHIDTTPVVNGVALSEVVPEPASLCLFVFAGTAMLTHRRRRTP
jgi:hypothetical protein